MSFSNRRGGGGGGGSGGGGQLTYTLTALQVVPLTTTINLT